MSAAVWHIHVGTFAQVVLLVAAVLTWVFLPMTAGPFVPIAPKLWRNISLLIGKLSGGEVAKYESKVGWVRKMAGLPPLGRAAGEISNLKREEDWILVYADARFVRLPPRRPLSEAEKRAIAFLAASPEERGKLVSIYRLGGRREASKAITEIIRRSRPIMTSEERQAAALRGHNDWVKKRARNALKSLEIWTDQVRRHQRDLERAEAKVKEVQRDVARYRKMGVLPPEEGFT